jgi:hypothetical protein
MCRKGNKIQLLKIIYQKIKQIKQVDDILEQPEVRDEPEPLENGNDNESAVDETDEPKIDELISNPDLAGKCWLLGYPNIYVSFNSVLQYRWGDDILFRTLYPYFIYATALLTCSRITDDYEIED